MTIKRRLFWSNIFMLVIPVVISVIFAYIILFVFTKGSEVPMERAFPQAFDTTMRYQRTGDIEMFHRDIDAFNDAFGQSGVFMMALLENGVEYPLDTGQLLQDNSNLLRAIFEDGATGSVTVNNMRFSVEKVRDRRILLVDNMYRGEQFLKRPMLLHVPVIFAILLIIILCTNQFLTRKLTRRIMQPINCLAEGARQLGDGNLEYRITYKRKDEFTPVCRDFNEMAQHLQNLIEYQQKNEIGRKELLAGMSHDLRTPLTSIKAYVEGLLDGVAEDFPSQMRYLGIIRNKAEDIDKLVDKLFLFSKLDLGEFPVNLERVDIGDELASMERGVDEEYRDKGLDMQIQDRLEGVCVSTDPVHLHNVFVNILENSLRYKTKERCTMQVRCFEDELSVVIWLTDDGPGVEEDEVEKIFDVFYRGDPSRRNPSKGSGLGLAISARMMERIGGSIRAENAPGGGLRMILKLPKCIDIQQAEEDEQ